MSDPFRYDWAGSIARITAAGESPTAVCFYCLPKAGVLMLVALMERLRWRASFDVPGYDYSDFEDIQDIVDDTEVALMTECDSLIGDIVTMVTNNLTTVIESQTTIIQAGEDLCCFLDEHPVTDPPPVGGPPIPGSDGRIELCKAAQKAHDNGAAFLTDVFNYGEAGGGVTAGLIAFLLGLYFLSFPAAVLLTVIGIIVGIILSLGTTEVEGQWAAIKPDIVCAIYTAETPTTAKAAVDSEIDAATLADSTKTLFKALYSQAQINKIWKGEVGSLVGYTGSYCLGCDESNTFDITYTFDTDEGSWILVSGVTYSAGRIRINVSSSGSPNEFSLQMDDLVADLGLTAGTDLTFTGIEVLASGEDLTSGATLSLRLKDPPNSEWSDDTYLVSPGSSLEISAEIPEVTMDADDDTVTLAGIRNGGTSQFIWVDNIRLTGYY